MVSFSSSFFLRVAPPLLGAAVCETLGRGACNDKWSAVGSVCNYLAMGIFVETYVPSVAGRFLLSGIAGLGSGSVVSKIIYDTSDQENSISKGIHAADKMMGVLVTSMTIALIIFEKESLQAKAVYTGYVTCSLGHLATDFYQEDITKIRAGASMPSFLTDLTEEVKSQHFDYIGDRKELEVVKRILCTDNNCNNICLIGDSGSGKTQLVKYLASQINCGNVPEKLQGALIVSVTSTELVAGASLVGTLQNKIIQMISFAENYTKITEKRCVIFIDELHQTITAGNLTASDTANIAEALLTHLTSLNICVIGATTTTNYERLKANQPFTKRFVPIKMPIMGPQRMRRILRAYLEKSLCKKPGLKEKLLDQDLEKIEKQAQNKGSDNIRQSKLWIDLVLDEMHQTNKSVAEALNELEAFFVL